MEHFGLTEGFQDIGEKWQQGGGDHGGVSDGATERGATDSSRTSGAAHIAQDNLCIQSSAKEACRSMPCPTVREFQRIKKSASFQLE